MLPTGRPLPRSVLKDIIFRFVLPLTHMCLHADVHKANVCRCLHKLAYSRSVCSWVYQGMLLYATGGDEDYEADQSAETQHMPLQPEPVQPLISTGLCHLSVWFFSLRVFFIIILLYLL